MSARALLLLAVLGLGACMRERPREDRVVVFAASSLREAFTELAGPFERAHPGVQVSFNFAGSQELAAQLEHGAPADVFAAADPQTMQRAVSAGRAQAPVAFAHNTLVLVVAKEAVDTVRTFAQLPSAGRIVVGAPEVPVGRYTQQVLERAGADFRAGVEAKVVSRELNVRQVLTKVTLGEADVGIVYRTDAQAAGQGLVVVEVPPELSVRAQYPIAVLGDAPHPSLARSWVEAVRGPQGQQALARAGFLPSEAP